MKKLIRSQKQPFQTHMDTDTETDIAAEKDTESVADVDIETSAGSVNGPAEKEENPDDSRL